MQTLSVNRQPGGLMPKEKLGATRTFRPRPKTAERLEYAETLGLNQSKLINDVLEAHLRDAIARELKENANSIEERQKQIREALKAPIP